MYNKNIEKLIESINILLSKNQHFFSVEDIELLNQCLLELEQLKIDLQGNESEKSILSRLESIIKTLDLFFGIADYIKKYFDLP